MIDTEEDIRRCYSVLRSRLSLDKPLTLLHIGADRTVIATASNVLVLPIWTEKTGMESFHHAPPTPAEIENAINVVEDEVTRAHKMTGTGSILCTTDDSIREIAHLAGVPDQPEMRLNRDAMESLFTRLAALSTGRPAAKDNLRVDSSFSAALLILREFMFHLGFTFINITSGDKITQQNEPSKNLYHP